VQHVVIEQQSLRLHVVGSKNLKAHASRRSSRRYPAPEPPRRSILYIGADQECRIILSRIVRRIDNARFVPADTGREGRLSAFARIPSLILLDSQVQDCKALALMSSFDRTALRATVPVAVLSPDDGERLAFIRAGAVAWIKKPLQIADVENSILRLLDLFTTR
jgi:DNA-binding response OmpR family regulator